MKFMVLFVRRFGAIIDKLGNAVKEQLMNGDGTDEFTARYSLADELWKEYCDTLQRDKFDVIYNKAVDKWSGKI